VPAAGTLRGMGRPRSEDARRRVIDAAVDALLAVGVEGTTVEEIAARSGVAKSTIYRNFGSRDALMSEAVRSRIVEYEAPRTGSLADDLEELFGRYDQPENRQINELFPLLLDAARRDPGMRAAMNEVLALRQRPLRVVLGEAQAREEVDPALDLDVALAMLIGPLTYRRMVQDRDITEEFIDVVLPGAIAALRSTALRPVREGRSAGR
jgi:AcrR family transcriptional regulator